jgi:hypothetical protein
MPVATGKEKNMNDLIPTETDIKTIQMMANYAKNSKFFDKVGGESGILCIMLAARELGVPLMQALCGGIRNIQGNIELSPRLMNSMIRRAGHQIHIIKCDEKVCTLKGVRKDTGEFYECTFSMADAARAGLAESNTYRKHPADMLFARCMSHLGRRLFADVIGAAYVEGEIDQKGAAYADSNGTSIAEAEVIEVVEEAIPEDEVTKACDLFDEIQDKDYKLKLLDRLPAQDFASLNRKDFDKLMAAIKRKLEAENERVA